MVSICQPTNVNPSQSQHGPDRFMRDLRQVLSQGRKRIGLLIGAGGPMSLGQRDKPLIPGIRELTTDVVQSLNNEEKATIQAIQADLGEEPTIEDILTRIRQLSLAIGVEKVRGLDSSGYAHLAENVCKCIRTIVNKELPNTENPYSKLVSWISGTNRDNAIEIFTPNYDMLFEQALERAKLPYFDGFTGAHKPFFDPPSIEADTLPSRWTRVWKIHGSLGWELDNDTIIRTGKPSSSMLVYPDHLKYDQISRQPYSALFERFRRFLMTPDSLLICAGFSFSDAQITSVIDESLSANFHTAILAFQFGKLANSPRAVELALRRPNLSVYARDAAVIFGVEGNWVPENVDDPEWLEIRKTFWGKEAAKDEDGFLLGDFGCLTQFLALTRATTVTSSLNSDNVTSTSEIFRAESPASLEDGDQDA